MRLEKAISCVKNGTSNYPGRLEVSYENRLQLMIWLKELKAYRVHIGPLSPTEENYDMVLPKLRKELRDWQRAKRNKKPKSVLMICDHAKCKIMDCPHKKLHVEDRFCSRKCDRVRARVACVRRMG